jgi:hypothetical protein
MNLYICDLKKELFMVVCKMARKMTAMSRFFSTPMAIVVGDHGEFVITDAKDTAIFLLR